MIIGFYRSDPPLASVRAERLGALAEAARRRGARLLLMDDASIDAASGTVNGLALEGGVWAPYVAPIPRVVMNDSPAPPSETTETGRWLGGRTTFTTHLIHGKYEIYQTLQAVPALAALVPPTDIVTGPWVVRRYLERFVSGVVVKPNFGRRGEGIAFLHRKEGGVVWTDAEGEALCSDEEWERRLDRLTTGAVYLVQPYVRSVTGEGEPFDFRVHVQRGGDGLWAATKAYPRIGRSGGGPASNLSQGGRTEPLETFLRERYPALHPFLPAYLRETGLAIAGAIDDRYPFDLDELGIDLAIDEDGRPWFFEANTSPEARHHERERAERAIDYALFLARGGEEPAIVAARPAAAETRERPPVIGMLVGVQPDLVYAEAVASIAKLHGADFYYFHPKNVKFESSVIRGYTFEKGEWRKGTLPYPDVVYDRFKRRGVEEYERMYAALDDIPFTHRLPSGSMPKEVAYEWLRGDERAGRALIPYLRLDDAASLLPFVDEHRSIVLKPAVGSHGKAIIMIKKRESDYELYDQQFLHYLKPADFRTFLEMFAGQGYVAQRYVASVTKEKYPFHLRVHLMRDGTGAWAVVFVQPFLSLSSVRQVTNHEDTLRIGGKWEWFLSSQYGETVEMEMDRKVRLLALAAADCFDRALGDRCHEIALDLGVDAERRLWVFEANFNQIGNTFHRFEAARFVVPYALHLLERNKKSQGMHPLTH